MSEYIGTATYSPDDNKLRLYPVARLTPDTYERVRAAGFVWAPKQELVVAPTWTPEREDLLIELCGQIGDEDTSLVERAEERADRFTGYSDARRQDAERAHEAVHAIADNIPLGQPILIGHHSERHARKDAEQIENGMRKAVKMWETSDYWKRRAAGAIAYARYKERPEVRHRRIKGIEADKRRQERSITEAQRFIAAWSASDRNLTREHARAIANCDHISRSFPLADYPRNPPASQYEGPMSLWSALGDTDEQAIITPAQAREIAICAHENTIRCAARWISHYNNRLEYERAMLDEQGGTPADQWMIEPGGRVLVGSEWYVVLRVNRSGEKIVSVTTNAPYVRVKGIETVKDYRAPDSTDTQKVKAATKQPPLCNFRSDGCIEMTTAEWKDKSKYSDALAVRGFDANGGYHWRREEGAPIVYRHRSRYYLGSHRDGPIVVKVFLTDAPIKEPPAPTAATVEPVHFERQITAEALQPRPAWQPSEEQQRAEEVRKIAAAGVQVVSVPQLFPTPPDLAARMVDKAGLMAGRRILDPSAGTGNLIRAAINNATGADCCRVVAVEVNPRLADGLREMQRRTLYANDENFTIHCADFLACNCCDLGAFDYILMNPPFENGSDIKHIQHAMKFLKPGGRLVAICADGPRQNDSLRTLVENAGGKWIPLSPGSFAPAGTGVNTVMLVYDAPRTHGDVL